MVRAHRNLHPGADDFLDRLRRELAPVTHRQHGHLSQHAAVHPVIPSLGPLVKPKVSRGSGCPYQDWLNGML